jgi:hypothetical protein
LSSEDEQEEGCSECASGERAENRDPAV